MRHPRLIVFAGALAALALMSVLSAMLGHVVPTLLPKQWTTVAAAILFWVFGGRMLQEGLKMEAGSGAIEEEMREVMQEIEEAEAVSASASHNRQLSGASAAAAKAKRSDVGLLQDLEEGQASPSSSSSRSHRAKDPSRYTDGARNLCGLFFSPIFIQAFILSFLAEWGDRSQITTIALGAAHVCFLSSCLSMRD